MWLEKRVVLRALGKKAMRLSSWCVFTVVWREAVAVRVVWYELGGRAHGSSMKQQQSSSSRS